MREVSLALQRLTLSIMYVVGLLGVIGPAIGLYISFRDAFAIHSSLITLAYLAVIFVALVTLAYAVVLTIRRQAMIADAVSARLSFNEHRLLFKKIDEAELENLQYQRRLLIKIGAPKEAQQISRDIYDAIEGSNTSTRSILPDS